MGWSEAYEEQPSLSDGYQLMLMGALARPLNPQAGLFIMGKDKLDFNRNNVGRA